jgi:chromosomal replication initiator protein
MVRCEGRCETVPEQDLKIRGDGNAKGLAGAMFDLITGNSRLTRRDDAAIWAQIRQDLRRKFGDGDFEAWVAPLRVETATDTEIRISAPTETEADWARRHVRDFIERRWSQLAGSDLRCKITSGGARRASAPRNRAVPVDARPSASVTELAEVRTARGQQAVSGVSEKDTFASYRVGDSNRAAHTLAVKIAIGQPLPFRLVLLHGLHGLGKSHLLKAIANEAASNGSKVAYLVAEDFLTGFVGSLKSGTTSQFRDKVRDADILLLDDLRLIAGKGKTEEELLHTLQAYIAADKIVVITADAGPDACDGLDRRIQSHLKGATAIEVTMPDMALRRDILATKAAMLSEHYEGFQPTPELLDLIAERCEGTGRELEGLLNRLLAQTTMIDEAITLEATLKVLGKGTIAPVAPSIDQIQKATAKQFGITQAELVSATRTQALTRPRHIACWLASRLTVKGYAEIGRRTGNRDHSTISAACDRIEQLRETDATVNQHIEAIRKALGY